MPCFSFAKYPWPRRTVLLLTVLLLVAGRAWAQTPVSTPFVLGRVDKLHSTVLAEDRVLNIYLPAGYDQEPTATYPVIYLLDGSADEDFIHIAGLAQYLNFPWINQLPKSIVVGIANVDRRRDLTFPTRNKEDLKQSPTSGKSAAFIRFLEQEVQPYIRKTYRTNARRTLIGQSLGGLLAVEVLLKRPALFDTYLIASPSLWWDDESLLRQAPQLLRKPLPAGTTVFVAVGNEGDQMQRDAAALAAALRAVPGVRTEYVVFPEETHATILHRAVYRAFEWLYKKP
ncbi:alpha/beta hydrolase [Hymenobacter lucidus]|uniref:Alpha/beta hydrolase n=1 Tax=Hymenobacter lucidus TaxID=2880930 RepID=A0ABS8ARB8_9BACT|nr:alpha/beta hydrolase-fold protein [Hymenobacter lucidus]MCB2408772.1 alpha/beta hydrolase [Hymenobacter lucidus]